MLGLMVRFLALLLLLRLFLRFVGGLLRGLQGPGAPARRAPERGVELVRDPVCRTFLPRAQALFARVGGSEQPFCSAACRDRALAGEAPGPA